MYRQMGARPNFSDIARRNGVERRTVARHWERGPGEPDGRTLRESLFDPYRERVEGRAALPGVTKRGAHGWLLDRRSEEEPDAAPLPGHCPEALEGKRWAAAAFDCICQQ